VEKFDYARKNRFSTYASWAIMKNYTRAATEEQWYQRKFTPLENEANVEREEEVYDPIEFERTQTRQQKRVAAILKCLTPREQLIIIRRFGLDRNYPPMTLKQVGEELGVTKERIRQIEILVIGKLREKNPVIPEV
ncbi:MAG: sigma-70 family RNA polymerase sigma factor, partial [Thermoguttaceae bacterium]|nr:sigma-70 family RNA polymerase sigma factor [Thermoguttaceae bacterium]